MGCAHGKESRNPRQGSERIVGNNMNSKKTDPAWTPRLPLGGGSVLKGTETTAEVEEPQTSTMRRLRSQSIDPLKRRMKQVTRDPPETTMPDSDEDSFTFRTLPAEHSHHGQEGVIESMLQHNQFFAGLGSDSLRQFARAMSREEVSAGKTIIRQGDAITRTSKIYLVFSGSVRVEITGGHPLKAITEGAGWLFGEIAVICGSRRTATVKASTDCILFSCTKSILMVLPSARLLRFMRQIPLLQVMSDNSLYDLFLKATLKTFQPGSHMISYGDVTDGNVFFIRHGSVVVRRPTPDGGRIDVATIVRGQLVGQRMIITGKMRSADCVAVDKVAAIALAARDFQNIDTPVLSGYLDFDALTAVMRHSKKVPNMVEPNIDDIFEDLEKFRYSDQSVIVKAGSHIMGLYIVRSGEVFSDRYDIFKEAGGFIYFGDVDGVSICQSNIIARGAVVILRCATRESPRRPSVDIARTTGNIRYQDLIIKRVVGIGNSGKVCLVVHKTTGNVYALKAMDKTKIRHAKQLQHTMNELNIVRSIDHPFVTKFVEAYQDSVWLYILQEYLPGGELFTYMQDKHSFSEEHAKFYAGNVLLALQYLHEKNIIYRDLKPENLLMSREGYIKIADFGFAKRLQPSARTFTICGTPAYQAPEIISKRGTSTEADVWSLGILIYELVFGDTPFESSDGDPMQTYKAAASGRFTVPKRASRELTELLYNILNVDPYKRPTFADIKRHRWFKNFDWDKLINQTLVPPIKPDIKSADDTTHFDDFSQDIPPDPKPDRSNPFANESWSGFQMIV